MRLMGHESPITKAAWEFAMADPENCDKEWAAYLALVDVKESASASSPTNSSSPLHHHTPAAAVTAPSTTRSTASPRVLSSAVSTDDFTVDDLSPAARRLLDVLGGGSSSPTPAAPLPVPSSGVRAGNLHEPPPATPTSTRTLDDALGLEFEENSASSDLSIETPTRCSMECSNGNAGLFSSTTTPATATMATNSTAAVAIDSIHEHLVKDNMFSTTSVSQDSANHWDQVDVYPPLADPRRALMTDVEWAAMSEWEKDMWEMKHLPEKEKVNNIEGIMMWLPVAQRDQRRTELLEEVLRFGEPAPALKSSPEPASYTPDISMNDMLQIKPALAVVHMADSMESTSSNVRLPRLSNFNFRHDMLEESDSLCSDTVIVPVPHVCDGIPVKGSADANDDMVQDDQRLLNSEVVQFTASNSVAPTLKQLVFSRIKIVAVHMQFSGSWHQVPVCWVFLSSSEYSWFLPYVGCSSFKFRESGTMSWFQFCLAGIASLPRYGAVQFQWEIAWPKTTTSYSIPNGVKPKFRGIAWTLRFEWDFVVHTDRPHVGRLKSSILALVEHLYNFSKLSCLWEPWKWSPPLMIYCTATLIKLSKEFIHQLSHYFSQLQDLLITIVKSQQWPVWGAYLSACKLQYPIQFESIPWVNRKKYITQDSIENVAAPCFPFSSISIYGCHHFQWYIAWSLTIASDYGLHLLSGGAVAHYPDIVQWEIAWAFTLECSAWSFPFRQQFSLSGVSKFLDINYGGLNHYSPYSSICKQGLTKSLGELCCSCASVEHSLDMEWLRKCVSFLQLKASDCDSVPQSPWDPGDRSSSCSQNWQHGTNLQNLPYRNGSSSLLLLNCWVPVLFLQWFSVLLGVMQGCTRPSTGTFLIFLECSAHSNKSGQSILSLPVRYAGCFEERSAFCH